MSSIVLFSEMTPAPEWEAEFNDWYDREHIPARLALPGFISARRYLADGRRYLAVYEIAGLDVLQSAPYQQLKRSPGARTQRMLADVTGFTRYTAARLADPRAAAARTDFAADAIDAPYLYAVWFNVPEPRAGEFEAWYAEDHVPTLLECHDWLGVRRFRVVSGEPETYTHLTLHYLATAAALESPERRRARASPWRALLAREPWFASAAYRLFETYGPRQRATP